METTFLDTEISQEQSSLSQQNPEEDGSNSQALSSCDSDGEGDAEEVLHELGAYSPVFAKRILAELESAKIPFEIEVDNTALANPLRGIQLYLCLSPEGSKIKIFVPETHLAAAKALEQQAVPAEL
jgi:hypothetical protein